MSEIVHNKNRLAQPRSDKLKVGLPSLETTKRHISGEKSGEMIHNSIRDTLDMETFNNDTTSAGPAYPF